MAPLPGSYLLALLSASTNFPSCIGPTCCFPSIAPQQNFLPLKSILQKIWKRWPLILSNFPLHFPLMSHHYPSILSASPETAKESILVLRHIQSGFCGREQPFRPLRIRPCTHSLNSKEPDPLSFPPQLRSGSGGHGILASHNPSQIHTLPLCCLPLTFWESRLHLRPHGEPWYKRRIPKLLRQPC